MFKFQQEISYKKPILFKKQYKFIHSLKKNVSKLKKPKPSQLKTL